MTAQTSSYFLIEKTESSGTIRLKPKDLVLPKIERPYKNEYAIVNEKELTHKCDLLIQNTFKELAPKDAYILKKENFPDRIVLSMKGTNKPSRLVSDDYFLKDIGQFSEWNSSCLKVIFKQPDKKRMKPLLSPPLKGLTYSR